MNQDEFDLMLKNSHFLKQEFTQMLRGNRLKDLLSNFMFSFETLFDGDWDMTKSCISSSMHISDKGTFLNPKADDEYNNWANRGGLLSQYRELREEMKKQGIHITWDDISGDK